MTPSWIAAYNGTGAHRSLRPCTRTPERRERRRGAFSWGYCDSGADGRGTLMDEAGGLHPQDAEKSLPHPRPVAARVPYRYLAARGTAKRHRYIFHTFNHSHTH